MVEVVVGYVKMCSPVSRSKKSLNESIESIGRHVWRNDERERKVIGNAFDVHSTGVPRS